MLQRLQDIGGRIFMNKLNNAFEKRKAFIPFITAGDPNLETTEKVILAMAEVGADLIEIGIPFSDPVAEGLVIQKADERALASGTTTDKIFDMVKSVRTKTDIPLAFVTYINPIFVYGSERFIKNSKACGIDALIVPDLPFEEKDELSEICKANSIQLISFAAPTSQERVTAIAKEAEGFVYVLSSHDFENIGEMVKLIKQTKDIPCTVGFGISTPEQAANMAKLSDGVIVENAVVSIIEKYGKDSVMPVADYVKEMADAVHNV